MKGIFKRNQLIITALAIMIAVAGYLNFVDNKVSEDVDVNVKATETKDLLEETIKVETEAVEDDLLTSTDDISSLDDPEEIAEGETSQPGEAVLVNTSGSLTFVNEAKLNREQVRSKNKALLMDIINNPNVSESQKQDAINSLIEITEISEKESAAELLLSAKGFDDAVVSITDGKADVLINMSNITDVQRAQIEDAVKSKTGIAAKDITITPIKSN